MNRQMVFIGPAVLLLLTSASGCQSLMSGLQPGSRRDLADPELVTVRGYLKEHNRQAEQVDSLKVSNLWVKVTDPKTNGRDPLFRPIPRADGVLKVQRPKNLRLVLYNPRFGGGSALDVGSNQDRFWFSDDMNNQMVTGHYQDLQQMQNPLVASLQPAWILEIFGLQPIPAEDIEVRPGPSENLRVLVDRRRSGPDQDLIKETVLDLKTGQIREHRLYTTDDHRLLAQARIRRYQQVPVQGPDGTETTVILPRELSLSIPELADMNMGLSSITINDSFETVAFQQPDEAKKKAQGYVVRDLRSLGSPENSYAATEPISRGRNQDPGNRARLSRRNGGSDRLQRESPTLSQRQERSASTDRQAPTDEQAQQAGGDVDPVLSIDANDAAAASTSSSLSESRFDYDLPRGPEPVTNRQTWQRAKDQRFPIGVLGR